MTGDMASVLGSWSTMLNSTALARLEGFVSFAEVNAPGNDSDDAQSGIAAADAKGRRLFANYGTYRVNSNITIASPLWMDHGAILKPASGVTVTINGAFDGTLSKHFDLSLGGLVAFTGMIESIYPQWWGMVADSGTTDNYAALQAATVAAQDARAELVIPDPGGGNTYGIESSWKITKALHVRGTKLSVTIQGFGLAAGVPVLDVDGEVNPNLENVRVESLQLMTDDDVGDCMHITRVASSYFAKLRLRDATNGIVYDGDRTYSNEFKDIVCVTALGANGLLASPHGGGHYFDNCSWAGVQGVNWRGNASRTADTVVFRNCNFESCGDYGALVQPLTRLRIIVFDTCRFEDSQGTVSLSINPDTGGSVQGLQVRGGIFTSTVEDWAVELGDGDVIGYSITDNVFEGYATAAIRWNGAGSHGVVHSNHCVGALDISDAFRDDHNAVFNNYSGSGVAGPEWAYVPALVQTYTETNVTTDRTYDANATTTDELADVLGTLIADLRAMGKVA